MKPTIINGDCIEVLSGDQISDVALTFLDPPFNQGKEYEACRDDLHEGEYWDWMARVCKLVFDRTIDGGAVYFMHREKNAARVISCLEEAGWEFQNLIIWKKKTSAVPSKVRFGKAYQIIVFAIKGENVQVFNRLRIDPPVPPGYEERPNGIFVTDIWDDIRELTSGFYADAEAYRDSDNKRIHYYQTPIRVLQRIILSSTKPNDLVFDPFAGTGTTLVVAKQLCRRSIGVELDGTYAGLIKERIGVLRDADDLIRFRNEYHCTDGLPEMLGEAARVLG